MNFDPVAKKSQCFLQRGQNCLENLQPLSRTENMAKGATYVPEQFEKWLASKSRKIQWKFILRKEDQCL